MTWNPSFLKRLFKRQGPERESPQFGRNAHADWKVLFISCVVLNLVAIGVSVFMYGKINKGEIFLVDKKDHVSVRTVDKFELERAVSFFANKQERFEALKRQPPPAVDPFIPSIKPKKI